MSFRPTDPTSSLARQQLMRRLVIEIYRLEPGAVEFVMPFDAGCTQQD